MPPIPTTDTQDRPESTPATKSHYQEIPEFYFARLIEWGSDSKALRLTSEQYGIHPDAVMYFVRRSDTKTPPPIGTEEQSKLPPNRTDWEVARFFHYTNYQVASLEKALELTCQKYQVVPNTVMICASRFPASSFASLAISKKSDAPDRDRGAFHHKRNVEAVFNWVVENMHTEPLSVQSTLASGLAELCPMPAAARSLSDFADALDAACRNRKEILTSAR